MNALVADARHMMMDLDPVKDGISSAFAAAKDWSKWLGREVLVLTSKGFEIAKEGVVLLFEVVKACWELSKPLINGAVEFLRSSAGIVTVTVTGALLLGLTALKLEDPTAQRILLGLSYLVFGFGLVYGCQAGIIPLLV
ncbi:MAG: hypothetical protein Q8K75_12865 [Chlamydiales bacterium]|nr:hypothetical protein [Chlamydiales bacterium]